MPYIIYGKRTESINGYGPDAKFAALDSRGKRVTKLTEAMTYATREDAQSIIDKHSKEGVIFEIRKAK